MNRTHAQTFIHNIWTTQGWAQRLFFITAGLNIATLSIFGWIKVFK